LPSSDDYIDQLQYLRKKLTKASVRDSVAIELDEMKSEDEPAKTNILDDDDSEDEANRLKIKKAKKKAEKKRKAEQLRQLQEDVETMKENMHDLHDKLDRLLNLLEKEEKQKEEKKQEPVSTPPTLIASGIIAALGAKVEEKSD
jgi:DNA repair exonuclease SbcCD ATPase subunit